MIASGCLVATVAASTVVGQIEPKERVINEDIDEFLAAVNKAVQAFGFIYVKLNGNLTMEDSYLENVWIGELSMRKRLSDAVVTGYGLQDFNVSLDFGLRILQIQANHFVSGAYSGALYISVLDNSAHLEFQFRDRFQDTCNVTVSSLRAMSFADPRCYTVDGMATGYMFEKVYIVDFFRRNLFGEYSMM